MKKVLFLFILFISLSSISYSQKIFDIKTSKVKGINVDTVSFYKNFIEIDFKVENKLQLIRKDRIYSVEFYKTDLGINMQIGFVNTGSEQYLFEFTHEYSVANIRDLVRMWLDL